MNQVRVRSDTIHLFPSALLGIVAAPSLVSILASRPAKAVKALGIGLALLSAVLLIGLGNERIESLGGLRWITPTRSTVERAGYARTSRDLSDVVAYIQENTTESEAIYVGVKNHDQFLINDTILYFLADRPSGTKYSELHPGVTTTLRVQEEIADELLRAPVRLLVLREGYWYEPNQTAEDGRVDLLDRTIGANYQVVERLSGYEVWSRIP